MPRFRYRLLALAAISAFGLVATARQSAPPQSQTEQAPAAALPIKHIVVVIQQHVSFDHYFATYPVAQNPPGDPPFRARSNTPAVDGLSGALMTANPNSGTNRAQVGSNPFRLKRSQAETGDLDLDYNYEQQAADGGKMDRFFDFEKLKAPPPPGETGLAADTTLAMGYYDGNTVTAVWNYAQRYALADHFFETNFGPSLVSEIDLVSGQTNGVIAVRNGSSPNVLVDGGVGSYTVLADADPVDDVCSSATRVQVRLGGRNVGDLLNAAGVSWGWFQGGFDLSEKNGNGTTGCKRSVMSAITQVDQKDYAPHYSPFQYYHSTANPQHTRPTSPMTVGKAGDPANHIYDVDDFYAAVSAGNFPSVSLVMGRGVESGHPNSSDPLDEQRFLAHLLNFLQQRPEWGSTAVLLEWDSTDGWYDHVLAPIVNSSAGMSDSLNGLGVCGDGTSILPGIDPANLHALGRCGYGPRLPLLAISPWARENFVETHVLDQTSILRFIEDTFLDARRIGSGSFDAIANPLNGMFDFSRATPANAPPLLLDESTGEPR